MFRRVNIFVIAFVCISSISIVHAGVPGGYSETPEREYDKLKIKLQNSNLGSALGPKSSCVNVVDILSAYQQVVAGMNYKIEAIVEINGKPKECCFKVYQNLPPNPHFNVNCAQCGACECFDSD